jgi:hypothetical protein
MPPTRFGRAGRRLKPGRDQPNSAPPTGMRARTSRSTSTIRNSKASRSAKPSGGRGRGRLGSNGHKGALARWISLRLRNPPHGRERGSSHCQMQKSFSEEVSCWRGRACPRWVGTSVRANSCYAANGIEVPFRASPLSGPLYYLRTGFELVRALLSGFRFHEKREQRGHREITYGCIMQS